MTNSLEAAAACDETQQFQSREAEAYRLERELGFAVPEFSSETKAEATKAAAKFVRKLTPSLVARKKAKLSEIRADAWKEIDPELRPSPSITRRHDTANGGMTLRNKFRGAGDPDAQEKIFETCIKPFAGARALTPRMEEAERKRARE